MNIAAFDYVLPEDLIAQYPAEPRDASRLMVVHRRSGVVEHRTFRDIATYLEPSDTLVLNRTRVMSARLRGVRPETGGGVEVVLVRQISEATPARWEALLKPGARLARGTRLVLEGGALTATVEDDPGPAIRQVRFAGQVDVVRVIEQVGQTPLPPYIRRPPAPSDRDRYQTVYAEEPGAMAAPTAGLHFTPSLLDRIRAQGTAVAEILLHTGPGTFQPIRTSAVEDHEMGDEYYRVEAREAETIRRRRNEGRVVAVGTTVVRTLETIAAEAGGTTEALETRRYEGRTRCFIYPPYDFRLVDALLTNFHLPKSTLLLLVSAFAGRALVLSAYEEAIREKYRFYSYGDAMLIV